MITHINLETVSDQNYIINKFFQKEYKVNYNKKLSGKIRLYISEKNTVKNISKIVMLYRKDLQ